MGKEPPPDAGVAFDKLQVALESALTFVHELAGDQLLGRLVAVFRAMPPQDRPVIIGVLEREVTGRILSRATEKPVGQSTHPNPNARLYVRVHRSELDRRHFDRDEMMVADIRAMRIALLVKQDGELIRIRKHCAATARAAAESYMARTYNS